MQESNIILPGFSATMSRSRNLQVSHLWWLCDTFLLVQILNTVNENVTILL